MNFHELYRILRATRAHKDPESFSKQPLRRLDVEGPALNAGPLVESIWLHLFQDSPGWVFALCSGICV